LRITSDRDEWDAYGPDHLGKVFIEPEKTVRVVYRGDDGSKFRAIVRQKPNPIGFNSRLPGDRRK
jgi:hypothetical protein